MFESWPLFDSALEQSFPDLGWSHQRIPIVGCSDPNSRWCTQVVRLVGEIAPRVGPLLAGKPPFGAEVRLGLQPVLWRGWLTPRRAVSSGGPMFHRREGPAARGHEGCSRPPLVVLAATHPWCSGTPRGVRALALAPLVECLNTMGELPPEPLAVDGSSLHALERLAPHACETSGHHWRLLCGELTIPATTPAASLSVLLPQTEVYQQATALLAARFRQQDEQLECTSVNLDRCTQQLESADATIRDLEKTVQELNQTMASSRTWRITRFLKRLVRVGT